MSNRSAALLFALGLAACGSPATSEGPAVPAAPVAAGRVVGQVIDRDAETPLSGALVSLMVDDEDADDALAMTTNSSGSFAFEGVAPGRYEVSAFFGAAKASFPVVVRAGEESALIVRVGTGAEPPSVEIEARP